MSTVASIVLGVVFVVAGAAKVASGRAWPEQARGMGVPTPLAQLVPWWELLVGALCIVGLARPVPAIAATVTLLVMTALIVRLLAAGRRPACACFGVWSASPLGWRHVARNVALVAIGVVAIVTA